MATQQRKHVHLTHWGAAEIESDGRQLTSVRPWREDPDPSRILENLAAAHHHPTRIDQPYIRQGWLEHGPALESPAARGDDAFVPVPWETALDLLADELRRVYDRYGPDGVFGGSYGWASAGRFHHAQSQLHRFLNCLGGYVRSVNNYSYGTSGVLLPHVVGDTGVVMAGATAWPVIAEHTDLIVAFGGLSPKNSAVASGGIGRHVMGPSLIAAVARGCRLVSVSPLRTDTDLRLGAEWIAPVPGTDAALMLALCHVLDAEGLADRSFLDRYTVGYPRFIGYVRGESDGVPKTPAWAAALTGIAAERIRALARRMTAGRTMVTVSWSLQRAQHGEQPVWLGLVLAAMLGQIGLPGGGFGHGYGSTSDVGLARRLFAPRLPQGPNGIDSYIPVARIADMLLRPGAEYDYNGQRRRYPDVKLVYWCGGNPFHHHQHLARLREAFTRPQTVVVHDPFWTATARHADIVLPSTMSVERDDFGAGSGDSTLFAMPQLTEPYAQARDDYATFADLADRLEAAKAFTEGRTAGEWLGHLYEEWRGRMKAAGHEMPSFEAFWDSESLEIPVPDARQVLLSAFRRDPVRSALRTASGKIEIFSSVIDGFGYPDCPGHPVWLEPSEWLGGHPVRYPLQLVANQPRRRLHSQLDVGAYSQEGKISGREPAAMNPADAAARGITDRSVVRLFNDRGSCLAGVMLSEDVRPGVVQLSTGAWYDPDPADPSFCRHGNPNVLTADRPSSALSQGNTGQLTMVEIEPYAATPPEITVHRPPVTVGRPVLAQPGPQVPGADGEDEDADYPPDEDVGQMGLDAGSGIPAGQAAEAERDTGGPVGGDGAGVVNRQNSKGHHPCQGGDEGRGQGRGRDVGGQAAGADQDRGQDGAAADAVDAAHAADQAGYPDQHRGRDVARRPSGVGLTGGPADGEPRPEREQDAGYDQIEDLRAGDEFDADDRSGDNARQRPAGEEHGQTAAGLVLPPVPVQGARGGHDVVEQVRRRDGRAGRAEHADLEGQQQDRAGDTGRGSGRGDPEGREQGCGHGPSGPVHRATVTGPGRLPGRMPGKFAQVKCY